MKDPTGFLYFYLKRMVMVKRSKNLLSRFFKNDYKFFRTAIKTFVPRSDRLTNFGRSMFPFLLLCSICRVLNSISPFVPNAPFLYPLITSEKRNKCLINGLKYRRRLTKYGKNFTQYHQVIFFDETYSLQSTYAALQKTLIEIL